MFTRDFVQVHRVWASSLLLYRDGNKFAVMEDDEDDIYAPDEGNLYTENAPQPVHVKDENTGNLHADTEDQDEDEEVEESDSVYCIRVGHSV